MDPEDSVRALEATPGVRHARQVIREFDALTLDEMCEIAAVPAPPFGERERARLIADRMRNTGLERVRIDRVGNVLARYPLSGGPLSGSEQAACHIGPAAGDVGEGPVLVAAHLDTVFPPDTRIDVRRDDGRIRAPGISDNARGLAAMLAIARALSVAGVRTGRRLVFVATVGEEGEGDLRGVKHLFRDGSPWRAASGFVALDGTGRSRIVHRALGCTRLRVTVAGPGGHSWADWGRANPVHALGAAIAAIAKLRLPRLPRSSLTVSRISGGTSVNAIPSSCSMEMDIRSEDAGVLAELEAGARSAVEKAVSRANAHRRRGTAALQTSFEITGMRPGGETPPGAWIVRVADAATRLLGAAPELIAASTDASTPISLGIPAITLGVGGESGGTHTTDEWYANAGGPEGIERALLTILGLTGVVAQPVSRTAPRRAPPSGPRG